MKSREFTPQQKYTKSYKSEPAMLNAIEKNGFENFRFVRHTFEDGRITPIFILDEKREALNVVHRGFSVVGG
tara:strand:- start:599 stop:814 length:216 start_codon:yes stop_codon:yes gene_type:complete